MQAGWSGQEENCTLSDEQAFDNKKELLELLKKSLIVQAPI
jgi:hypothetical protein